MNKPTNNIRVCTRCVMDTTISNITFDEKGVCNYCKLHDMLEKQFPLNEETTKKLEVVLADIKRRGRDSKYDCVVGISGGRDSTYTLYITKKFGLRPLAVHFNDGWGNPVCGENMKKITQKLGVDFRVITSDWRESKDIKISFLKASTPELDLGTDIGYPAALYGVAVKENVKTLIFGHCFRTEGIMPLEWDFADGKYLKEVYNQFGSTPLRKWSPTDPGFNLEMKHVLYYTLVKRIKFFPILNYVQYNRDEVGELLKRELDWRDTPGRYFDDLYHGFMSKVLREKFNIDLRKTMYSAMIRNGQMAREEVQATLKEIQASEDPKIISLCIQRLAISQQELDEWLARPIKTFRDYPTSYNLIKLLRPFVWLAAKLHIIPDHAYAKYFNT